MHPSLRRKIFLLALLLITHLSYCQESRPASYVDGVAGLNQFFKQNMNLKAFDLDRDFHGTVVLRMRVNFLGIVDSVYVWFSPTKELGEEALRVMKLTRDSWNAAVTPSTRPP